MSIPAILFFVFFCVFDTHKTKRIKRKDIISFGIFRKSEIKQFIRQNSSLALARAVLHLRNDLRCGRNYKHGPTGKALGFDGLRNQEKVSNDSLVAFKTALWLWMTERKPKPSCPVVMVGKTAGLGLVANIIYGGLECGLLGDARVNDRLSYFRRYVELLGVDTEPNLDCQNQKSF
ncbi:hypothetical protein EUGRSUZ_I01953 [Eucalyptus grandis]|uniref:Uncharacterized protein n=2 Tax=Eucalyptus grandis TaxID=71139 RepID=A0ACC3JGY5_EUCGR|nr:hypothetical protein EUGRSUZ_I01953 [Eucalyptus grandis]